MSLSELESDLRKTLANLRRNLLSLRNNQAVWEGELSSSALSTATAIIALSFADARRHARLIKGGFEWLIQNQNDDGGWGDTGISFSNISTTALCWSALSLTSRANPLVGQAIARAETWLEQTVGDLTPQRIVDAITARYGKDRTFSIPILSTMAMTGRIGNAGSAWSRITPLPFELAACPHKLFKWLQIPVVSYALPALIALGQVRHGKRPTRNPLTYMIRQLTRRRTLNVLREIQPASGGYLEAAPLTGFVVMSLAHIGLIDHPVVEHGVRFLTDSVRDDGSWPIDTNLSTWVTTLAINGLAVHADFSSHLTLEDRRRVQAWLLDQQVLAEHPFTHAEPGGWAWTDLSGGVPDGDDTPGALLALTNLHIIDARVVQAAERGIIWLLNLQNRDGGMPTFCRGWGRLPFDRSAPDLTAHALRAFMAWRPRLAPATRARVDKAIQTAIRYLLKTQTQSGAWIPLWFGNQHTAGDENPIYGTSKVLQSLCVLGPDYSSLVRPALVNGTKWLLSAQSRTHGWGGDNDGCPSIEETALAVDALAGVYECIDQQPTGLLSKDRLRTAITEGASWLVRRTNHGEEFPTSPVGFYFAKLWYFEKLYPMVFTVSALNRVARIG